MWKNAILGIVGAATLTNVAFAACQPNVCVDVAVERLYIHANSLLYIATDADETQLDCVPYVSTYVTLNPNDANFDAIYSALLAAQIANRVVTIRIFNGSSTCRVMYVMLDQQ